MITQNSWELVKSIIFLLCPSIDFFLLFRTSYLVENIIVWSPHSFSSVVTRLDSHHLSFSFFPWNYKLPLFPDTLFGGSIFHRKFSGSFCVTWSTNAALVSVGSQWFFFGHKIVLNYPPSFTWWYHPLRFLLIWLYKL